jgi:hypothetical protein
VQVGDQHLGHREAVIGCLLGNLFQPVDATELALRRSLPSWSIARVNRSLAWPLQSQLSGGCDLPAVLGELLERQHCAGEDRQPGDGLQGAGAQVVLELEPGVNHF